MPAIASYSRSNADLHKACSSRCRKTAIAFALGKALAVCTVSAGICSDFDYRHENSIKTAMWTEQDSTYRERQCIRVDAESMRATVVGTASMYNPYGIGHASGGKQTASGEMYDPTAWTAAIQIDLREQFGGVHYGKYYRPTFALVESADKHVIVKINDVGPLKPGRVIDLNEQSMRYFDPTLEIGCIQDIKITLLSGDDWTPGPISGQQLASVAAEQLPGADWTFGSIEREQLIGISAEALPGEDPTPTPNSGKQPLRVATEQSRDEDRALAPNGGEQPIRVATEALPDEAPTPEPTGNQQPIKVAAEKLPGEDWTPGPSASQKPISVAAAPYRIRYPSHKAEVIAAQFVLIAIIAMLLALPAAAPMTAGGAEDHAATPRPRRRRKSRRKATSARTARAASSKGKRNASRSPRRTKGAKRRSGRRA